MSSTVRSASASQGACPVFTAWTVAVGIRHPRTALARRRGCAARASWLDGGSLHRRKPGEPAAHHVLVPAPEAFQLGPLDAAHALRRRRQRPAAALGRAHEDDPHVLRHGRDRGLGVDAAVRFGVPLVT